MSLKQSSSKKALQGNMAEMIASQKQPGSKMNSMTQKFGKAKARQMAIAAAFDVQKKVKQKGK